MVEWNEQEMKGDIAMMEYIRFKVWYRTDLACKRISFFDTSFPMDDDDAELRNPFPSPPSHYIKYAPHNLKLLALLRERVPDPSDPTLNQYEVLSDQTDIPDWPLTQLEKPRVDWILEEPDAYYDVFGDRWFVRRIFVLPSHPCTITCTLQVKEKIPSLAELGGNQLYPADPSVGIYPTTMFAK